MAGRPPAGIRLDHEGAAAVAGRLGEGPTPAFEAPAATAHGAACAGYLEAAERVGETVSLIGLGTTIAEVRIAGPLLSDLLLPGLGCRVAAGEGDPSATLLAWESGLSGVVPPTTRWSRDDYLPRDEIRGSGDGGVDASYNITARCLSLWDRATRCGVFWVHEAALLPPWEPTSPLRHLVHWWSSDLGLAFAHAAVVGNEDGGVLLVGRGGSGKSTSALACVEAGWSTVGDDYCVLEPGDPPLAHSVYGVAKLDDNSASLLPGMMSGAERRVAGGKWILPLDRRTGSWLRTLALSAVVVPRPAAATGRPRRVPSAVGLAALAPSTLMQLSGLRPDALALLGSAVRDLPVFTLDVGPDVAGIPSALAEVVRQAKAAGAGAAAADVRTFDVGSIG